MLKLQNRDDNLRSDGPVPVGICVPTNRRQQAIAFLQQWARIWADTPGVSVRVFLHEDCSSVDREVMEVEGITVHSTSHETIDAALEQHSWIIPRGSGACRSFPMYMAWKAHCEYIITLDDDCLPEGTSSTFVLDHLAAFKRDRWFRTIDGPFTRGFPYRARGCLPVLLNHGLWSGVPDLDGPTSLVGSRQGGFPHCVRAPSEVIPPGMFFTLCGMNVCYHRSAIPAAYNLLMGLDSEGFDRFDDIWSGLF